MGVHIDPTSLMTAKLLASLQQSKRDPFDLRTFKDRGFECDWLVYANFGLGRIPTFAL